MVSGWNLWAWLECIGVVSGCCCKEVYRYRHNTGITYPNSLVLALFCNSITTSSFILKRFFPSLRIIESIDSISRDDSDSP